MMAIGLVLEGGKEREVCFHFLKTYAWKKKETRVVLFSQTVIFSQESMAFVAESK